MARGAPPGRVRPHHRRRPRRPAGPSRRPTATPSSRCATSTTCAPRCGGGSSTSSTGSAAAPTAMWLPETAVSDAVLLRAGRGGDRGSRSSPPVRSRRCDRWAPTTRRGRRPDEAAEGDPAPLDTSRPYRWQHPEQPERTVDLVVYDGELAHALAFARPTSGDILDAAARRDGLVAAATDGETFGHHHAGAERGRRAGAHASDARRRGVRTPAPGRPARPTGRRRTRPACASAPGRAPTASAAGWPTAAATPAARRAGTRRGERPCATPSTCCATGASSSSIGAGPSCCATRGRPATTTSRVLHRRPVVGRLRRRAHRR